MTTDLSSLVSEAWLRACPTGILVLREGHILWANPAFERISGIRLSQLQGDAEPALVNRLKGAKGLVRLQHTPDHETWAFCEISPVDDIELRFFQDVSGEVQAAAQRDSLAQRVEDLNLTDELTGLANPRALGRSLDAQVTRSRRYHNSLSLAVVRLQAGAAVTPLPDGIILSMSRFLRERLRWADIIGRHHNSAFMLILPETDLKAANRLLESIRDEARDLHLPAPHEDIALHIRMGIVQWDKGMDPTRLIGEAEQRCAVDNPQPEASAAG